MLNRLIIHSFLSLSFLLASNFVGSFTSLVKSLLSSLSLSDGIAVKNLCPLQYFKPKIMGL